MFHRVPHKSDVVTIELCAPHGMMHRTCRCAATLGLPLLLMTVSGFTPDAAQAQLPPLAPGEIQHVIVVMMENRSFDHALGWVPGADGQQAGLTYYDSAGTPHNSHPLAPDFQGCGHVDPNHSYCGGRYEWNLGACNGWLYDCALHGCAADCRTNDTYAIGYYEAADLPFYTGAAGSWTVCDRYFPPIMAGTWPNKMYQYAADTDRLVTGDFTPFPSTLPTIFDVMATHGVTARYYFSDVPLVGLWGATYLPITRHVSQFFADCTLGALPDVAFIDPRFLSEGNGTSCDDHPFADMRCGQSFLNSIYECVIAGPNWANTVLVINFDEWGGFFDHVDPDNVPGGRPPPAPVQATLDTVEAGLRGFRTPCFVISPWAPRGAVAHGVYDHTSVMRMIEWNWNLPPLTIRDLAANNLANVLTHPWDPTAPHFTVPAVPVSNACPSPNADSRAWLDLYRRAQNLDFPVPVFFGDMDCNGIVDLEDAPAMVLALLDPMAYIGLYGCDLERGDFDGDQLTDGGDLQAFISALVIP